MRSWDSTMLAGLGRGVCSFWSQSETGITDFYSFISINDDLRFIDCLVCVQPPAHLFTNVTLLNPRLPCYQAPFYRGGHRSSEGLNHLPRGHKCRVRESGHCPLFDHRG